MFVVVLLSD